MQNWDLVRAFLALHRCGEYEGAAQALGIDHSTLRRRINRLEQDLGTVVFIGTDGNYVVNPKAASLIEAAMQMDMAARHFFDAPPDEATGDVRVTMLDVFAHLLAPDLDSFAKRNVGINLAVTTEAHFVDLEREMVDVAVRMARPTRGSARIRRIADIHYGVYASPAYLKEHDRNGGAHRLIGLAVTFIRDYHEFPESDAEWMLRLLPAGQVVCQTDSYLLLREYCAAGMGVALLPEQLVEGRDDLVCLAPRVASCELFLVINRNTGEARRVRKFVDFISAAFKKRASSSGGSPARALSL